MVKTWDAADGTEDGLRPRPFATFRRGHAVVAACTFAMACGYGAGSLITVFIAPLESGFGWSRGELSFSYTLFSLGAAFGGLGWGYLADRFSTRVIAVVGAVVLSVGLLALGYQTTLTGFYLVNLAMGAAGLGCFYAPLVAAVGPWFDKSRGLALGVVTAGGALGQGVVPLIGQHLIDAAGWQIAYWLLGAGFAALLVPAALVVSKPPASAVRTASASDDGDGLVLPRRVSVGMLSAASFFCCATMAVPLVHVVPLLTGCGFQPTDASNLQMLVMLSATVGRIVFGVVADRIGPLASYAAASALQSVALCGFVATRDPIAIALVSTVFGFGFAGVMTCLILSIRESVPGSVVGRSIATVGVVAWLGMGFGGYTGGVIYDATLSYVPAFLFALAMGTANLAILGTLALMRNRAQAALQLAAAGSQPG